MKWRFTLIICIIFHIILHTQYLYSSNFKYQSIDLVIRIFLAFSRANSIIFEIPLGIKVRKMSCPRKRKRKENILLVLCIMWVLSENWDNKIYRKANEIVFSINFDLSFSFLFFNARIISNWKELMNYLDHIKFNEQYVFQQFFNKQPVLNY